jgi:hypothetical protein
MSNRECLRARGGVADVTVSEDTSLTVSTGTASQRAQGIDVDAPIAAGEIDPSWVNATAVCATATGNHTDNPREPTNLTPEQKARSFVLTLEAAASFDVLLSIHDCCTPGRNFL